jgi:transcriptional regulator with XRE-family HTH domain
MDGGVSATDLRTEAESPETGRVGNVTEEKDAAPDLLGAFIRTQRQLANLSLRQLSAMTDVSNPYLSQLERGLHQPSMRVLKSIAEALNISAETLMTQAGMTKEAADGDEHATEAALQADPRLTEPQKRALLSVYRSYVEANEEP